MFIEPLVAVARSLAGVGVPTLRFDFDYRVAGRRAPDRAPVLMAAVETAAAELSRRTGLPRDRLVLGGRSMGGRICSMVAAEGGALGCVLLGYPLHPPGRPDRARTAHLVDLAMPVLFVHGTRDAFGTPEELRAAAGAVPGPVTFHWVETGDHGFRPLKASGRTVEDETAAVAEAVTTFVLGC